MRRLVSFSASVLVLSLSGVAIAQAVEFAQRDPAFPQRSYTCRLNGDDIALGERRCLRTPQGQRLAECSIALNMSSWRSSAEPCP